MDVSDVFSEGFKVWKKNYKVGIIFFLGNLIPLLVFASATFWIIRTVAGKELIDLLTMNLSAHSGYVSNYINYTVHSYTASHAGELLRFLQVMVVLGIVSFLIYEYFLFSGIRYCVLALDGKAEFRGAFGYALRRYLSFLAAVILKTVVVVLVTAPFIVLAIIFASSKQLALTIFSGLAAVLAVVLALFFLIYVDYAVADGCGAVESIAVSARVTKNTLLNTILIFIVAGVLGSVSFSIARLVAFPFYMGNPTMLKILEGTFAYLMIATLLNSFIVQPLKSFFFIVNMRGAMS